MEYSFSVPSAAGDGDLAHALDDFADFDDAVDLAHDGCFAGLAGFEELDHAGQTAGDVLGLGGGARDLGEYVAGVHLVAVAHAQVGVGGHEVAFLVRLVAAVGTDDDRGEALLVGRIDDDPLREAGDFVELFVVGDAGR